jgi:hypothetical protein
MLSGTGMLSEATDEAFQRILRDILALYQHMFREKLFAVWQETLS